MLSDDLVGHTLTVVLIGRTADGEDDWAVFPGTVVRVGGALALDRGERPAFNLDDAWLERVKAVPEELAAILRGSTYFLPLAVDNINDADGYVDTGLRWPE